MSNTNLIVARPCFLDPSKNSFNIEVSHGSTISEIVARAFPTLSVAELQFVHAYVVGTEIPQDMWSRVRPLPNVSVILRIIPAGGSFGSSFLQIGVSVLTMGLTSAFAGPLGLALGISSQFASGLLGFGIQAIAGLLLNALVPQPHQNKDKKQYTIQGWKNTIDPDGVVPNLFGKIRFAPPMCAGPYTQTIDDDRFIHSIFCFGYGPVLITDLRIGDTPIEHYHDVDIEIRNGYDTDEPFTLYNQQVIEDTFTKTLQYEEDIDDTPLPSNHVTAGNTVLVQLDFHFPEGLYHTNHAGDVQSSGVIIKIEYRKITTEDWILIEELHISKHKTKPFFKQYDWIPPERAQYEIRCTRLNLEQASARKHSQVDWVTVRSFRPEYPINFPFPLAMVCIRIRASKQLQGMLDNFNALASRVCKDWDADTATWIDRETSNPASCYRLEMQGNQMTFPRTDGQLDLVEIQAWHEYCDLKTLTYDRLHDRESSWRDNLQDIGAAGRATPQDRGDKWSVVVDRPKDTVMSHITPRNSFNFEWNTVYSERPNAFRVKFLDKTNDYIEATRDIPWPDFVGSPLIIEDLNLPGYVEAGLVYREARRRQLEIELRPHRYVVSQDIESVINTRGDLVYLNHDVLDVRQTGSRVKQTRVVGSVQVVELDDEVTMTAGSGYVVVFRNIAPDATDSDVQPARSLRRTVTTHAGTTNILFLAGPGDLPNIGDLAAFGTSAQVYAECIIQRIESNDNLTARLTLLPHAPELELLADEVILPAWDGAVGEASDSVIMAPAVPIINEIESGEDTENNDVLAYLKPGAGTVPVYGYELQHRLQGAVPWTTVTVSAGIGAVEFTGYVYGDIIEVRARAVGLTGLTSAYTAIATHTFGGNDLRAPANVIVEVAPFVVNAVTGGVRLVVEFDDPVRNDRAYVVRWRLQDIDPTTVGNQPDEWTEELHDELLVADAGRLQLYTLEVPGDTIVEVQIAAIDTLRDNGTNRSSWSPTTPVAVDTTTSGQSVLAVAAGFVLEMAAPDTILRM
jgi:hypothetical protein